MPFFVTKRIHVVCLPSDFSNQIDSLTNNIQRIASEAEYTDTVVMCLDALRSLKDAGEAVLHEDSGPGAMWIWPMSLSEEFINLISISHPIALVILACFVVLLHQFEHKIWCLSGWSTSVFNSVYKVLDVKWKRMIAWPLQYLQKATGVAIEDTLQ